MRSDNKYVFIAGSINMDIVASSTRIPEPGMTLLGKSLDYFPGGKGANQAVASKRAGSATKMLGCVGNDVFAKDLSNVLLLEGIDIDAVKQVEGSSGVALIVVDDLGENSIVVIPGANAKFGPNSLTDIDFSACLIAVSQFEIPVSTIEKFFLLCKAVGALTVLNTAPAIDNVGETFNLADILIFNETELAKYSQKTITANSSITDIESAARSIRISEKQRIVITLGKKGLLAIDNSQTIKIKAHAVSTIDTTGAGDCFVGYFVSQMLSTMNFEQSLQMANKAASLSVQKHGAIPSIPYFADIKI